MPPARRPPVIVLGMHRSGTSLLAGLLHGLGCWMCPPEDLEVHAESRFFLRLDEDLLRRFGASWCRVEPALERLRDPAAVEEAADGFRREVEGRLDRKHFGREFPKPPLSGRWPAWGFKDPRATVLFPAWDRVFPEARALHILRDGRDVALSIVRREEELDRVPVVAQERLHGGFPAAYALWETHVREGLRHEAALGPRCLRLRYEDLQAAPAEHLGRILAHIGVEARGGAVAAAAKRIRPRGPRDAGKWEADVAAAASPIARSLGYEE